MGTPRALMGGFLIYVSFLAFKKNSIILNEVGQHGSSIYILS